MRRSAPLTLKARAVQWLSMREHSRLELRGKLLRHLSSEARKAERLHSQTIDPTDGPDATAAVVMAPDAARVLLDVDALLDDLQTKGLLSDERFAASRLRVRSPKLGARRIEAELRRHGVEPDANTTNSLRESEYSRALAVWQKKYGGKRANDRAEMARQARFLASRGFDPAVIARVVRADDEALT